MSFSFQFQVNTDPGQTDNASTSFSWTLDAFPQDDVTLIVSGQPVTVNVTLAADQYVSIGNAMAAAYQASMVEGGYPNATVVLGMLTETTTSTNTTTLYPTGG